MRDGLGAGYDNWRLASPPEREWCDYCPCGEAESPEQVWLDGDDRIACNHSDVCGCDQCDCSCHAERDFDPPEPDDWYDDGYMGPV